MKVYFTYTTDGYNCAVVDKIFKTKELATNYLLDGELAYLKKNYSDKVDIDKHLKSFIHEGEVIE